MMAMTMKKRIVAGAVALALGGALSACSAGDSDGDTRKGTQQSSPTVSEPSDGYSTLPDKTTGTGDADDADDKASAVLADSYAEAFGLTPVTEGLVTVELVNDRTGEVMLIDIPEGLEPIKSHEAGGYALESAWNKKFPEIPWAEREEAKNAGLPEPTHGWEIEQVSAGVVASEYDEQDRSRYLSGRGVFQGPYKRTAMLADFGPSVVTWADDHTMELTFFNESNDAYFVRVSTAYNKKVKGNDQLLAEAAGIFDSIRLK